MRRGRSHSMKEDFAAFFAEVLPRLGLRVEGFANFGGTLRKRLRRRMGEGGAGGLEAYRERLVAEADEWGALDAVCRIPISRFCRDRAVFEILAREIL